MLLPLVILKKDGNVRDRAGNIVVVFGDEKVMEMRSVEMDVLHIDRQITRTSHAGRKWG